MLPCLPPALQFLFLHSLPLCSPCVICPSSIPFSRWRTPRRPCFRSSCYFFTFPSLNLRTCLTKFLALFSSSSFSLQNFRTHTHTHTQPRLSSILNCRDNLTSSFLASRSPVEVVVPQCINRPDSSSSPPSVCTSELKPSSPLLSSALSSSLPLSPYQLENHVSGSPLITLPGNSSSQKASCFIFVV